MADEPTIDEAVERLTQELRVHDAMVARAGENLLMEDLRTLLASHVSLTADLAEAKRLARDAWGALNFILAFYEPGQTYLDTNAWKQAEARGRLVHAALAAFVSNKGDI